MQLCDVERNICVRRDEFVSSSMNNSSRNRANKGWTRRDFIHGTASAALVAGGVPAILPEPAPGQDAPPDPFALWQQGALRGANVMQAQCTLEDLRVLRAWGANLAEIPVSNVYAPTPPYAFEPENLAKLDQA